MTKNSRFAGCYQLDAGTERLHSTLAAKFRSIVRAFCDAQQEGGLCGFWSPKRRAMMVETALVGQSLKTCAIVLGLHILLANSLKVGPLTALRKN